MGSLVIGSGLLGSSVIRLGGATAVSGIPWHSEAAAVAELQRQVRVHVSRDDWSVTWCAGAGVVGSDLTALSRETRYLSAVLDAAAGANTRGRLFLASSAGGVHGLGSAGYIDETTVPAPSSEYGRNKLRQEALATEWSQSTGNALLIGRISNLYGPGQRLSKPQGMVSQTLARCLLGRSIVLMVPEETQRDYLYVDDAAQRIVSWLGSAGANGDCVKLLAAGRSITLSRLFRVIRAVTKVEPRIVRRSSPTTHLQPRHLRFRSVVLPELDIVPARSFEVGVRQTWDGLLREFGRSGLDLA